MTVGSSRSLSRDDGLFKIFCREVWISFFLLLFLDWLLMSNLIVDGRVAFWVWFFCSVWLKKSCFLMGSVWFSTSSQLLWFLRRIHLSVQLFHELHLGFVIWWWVLLPGRELFVWGCHLRTTNGNTGQFVSICCGMFVEAKDMSFRHSWDWNGMCREL